MKRWLFAGALTLAAACAGAEAQEPRVLRLADLPPSAGLSGSSWQSVGWSGDPWHPYDANRVLVVQHDLGRTPQSVLVYLSFVDSGDGAALAAGDLAQVVEVGEAEVHVQNRTAQDYFCRVVFQ